MLSMTAFARSSVKLEGVELICEMRSVNHRFLDLTVRMPDSIRQLEPKIRQLIKDGINRGKVDCSFSISSDSSQTVDIKINENLVSSLAKAANRIDDIAGKESTHNAIDIMRWPGVVEEKSYDAENLLEACLPLSEKVLTQFVDARGREAEALAKVMLEKVNQIKVHVDLVANKIPEIIKAQRERLLERCAELSAEVDSNRLEQELLFFAQKLDVAEEMDRLSAHVAECKKILSEGGIVGRRLDFLMQELNREANTLSSKSVDSQTTQAAVEMKVLIEQMREQAQNIE